MATDHDAEAIGLTPSLGSGESAPLAAMLAQAFIASVEPDLAMTTYDSPVGELVLVASAKGAVRVLFADVEDVDAALADVAACISPRLLRTTRLVDPVRHALDEYFSGASAVTAPIDLVLAHGFRRDVLDHLRSVPYGTTVSYAELASMVGRPRAVRAAASACATNPLPIMIPCHRVVRSDGTLGGYLGGLDAKRALLALEARPAS